MVMALRPEAESQLKGLGALAWPAALSFIASAAIIILINAS